MSLKSYIAPRLAEKILGEPRLLTSRLKYERRRLKANDAHVVEFFHDPSDPYSQLLQKILPSFQSKFEMQLMTHHVSPPDGHAAPEVEMLKAYSRIDAARLAKKADVEFEYKDYPVARHTSVADTRRETLGHYLGGMLYYGGEWYWGLDRLHYLEDRLTQLGARKDGALGHIFSPPKVPVSNGKSDVDLHWYLSFRSPYTAITCERVKNLAEAYGAKLHLRFVLPMVMRGLPVPPSKKKYIPLDTAREARRLGVPFGRVLDPVGKPVEMGYSLLPWARENGKDYDYAQSWLSAVWAEGIDAGSHKGLKKIVERASLDWNEAKNILGNNDWRSEAEANRAEMMERGIWGVPSFRIGDTITWGQDRLWFVEKTLAHSC